MTEYKVVTCESCKKLQISISEKSFKCKYCGRNNALGASRTLFRSYSHRDALTQLYRLQGTDVVPL